MGAALGGMLGGGSVGSMAGNASSLLGIGGSLMKIAPHQIILDTIMGNKALEYEEKIAKNNAIIARQKVRSFEQKERQAQETGSYEVRQQRLQQEAMIAQGMTSGAAGGVQLGSGSILDWEVSAEEVFDEDRRQLDYDISNRVYNARVGAWNAQIELNSHLQDASNIRSQQQQNQTLGIIKAATGLGALSLLGMDLADFGGGDQFAGHTMSGESMLPAGAMSEGGLGTGSIGRDTLPGGAFGNTSAPSYNPSTSSLGTLLSTGKNTLFY